jgi:hypothetical protein
MTFSIPMGGCSATTLSDIDVSQQSERRRRDRLEM